MGEFSTEEKEAMKAEAGIAACNFVKDGMKIGIGTGSTVKYTILELGRRIREEGLEISGIPTSEVTITVQNDQCSAASFLGCAKDGFQCTTIASIGSMVVYLST